MKRLRPQRLISSLTGTLMVALLVRSAVSQLCTVCDDVPDESMLDAGETCESVAPTFLNGLCNKDDNWKENKFCSQSCFDQGVGYDDMLDCCPGCSVCDDVAPAWWEDEHPGSTCGNPPPIQLQDVIYEVNCKNKQSWVDNAFCKQSCFNWGFGYDGVNCCPKCATCSNTPTPWMDEQGITCENAPPYLLNNNCNKRLYWVEYKFCQQSCFDWGAGYDGVNCCPGCSTCDNRPTEWMEDVAGYTCDNAPRWLLRNNCNNRGWWRQNRYCAKACYEFGSGYDGMECCPECTVCDDRRAPYLTNPKRQSISCVNIEADVPEDRPDYAHCDTNQTW
eukprot:CAMPEP_0194030758 /NCGR_PEP_ID=MMETSP0009_2-20130614/4111_1 /TAXON_ID=210454 /ORGANISM="Grammatophora oceanica, Strain CCMP 410" /LENGTH=332 /DNA_ID=CAMNT_0038670757 /DNA_START=160 /DNA_END=1155 /DNA_ORIENTATION=-